MTKKMWDRIRTVPREFGEFPGNSRSRGFDGGTGKRENATKYGIERHPASTRNPQANSVLERIHKTIGNMIRTHSVDDGFIDMDDPWSGILPQQCLQLEPRTILRHEQRRHN